VAEYLAEFFIEPFTEGSPGPPVQAGIEAVRSMGLTPDVGAFGTTVVGDAPTIAQAVSALMAAALGAGATRVSLQVVERAES
jgi:uncharacterized protein YqgV (UPF0045/DUF77 family)